MGRSSRILAFLCITGGAGIGAAPACAQGPVGVGRGPGLVTPHAGVNPGVNPGIDRGVMPNVHTGVMPGVHPNVTPNIRPGVNPDVRPGVYDRRDGLGDSRGRFGRLGDGRGRFGYGGGDLDAAGLGLGLGNDLPSLPYGGADYGGGFGPYPPRFMPADLPVCPHPLIISIGRGLRHQVHTHVVYGAPPACVP